MRTIVFGSLLLFVLQACGNASSPEYESGDGTARHVSIAYLKSLCRGVLHPVTEDLWIEGCVVGNDLYGEFPDALVVEDESGGIEVLIDAKRLYRTFDSGSTVRVYCNGLALGDYGGKVQLGLPPTAEYILDRISAESLGRHVRRIGDGSVDFVPRELSFGEGGCKPYRHLRTIPQGPVRARRGRSALLPAGFGNRPIAGYRPPFGR